MRHPHLRSPRWSYAAVSSCLERGGLVQWRGLMRAVSANPDGTIATYPEHVLDDLEDSVHDALADPDSFEGGVDSVTQCRLRYPLAWHAYLRDARAWRVAHPARGAEGVWQLAPDAELI